ncbi:hypothetical protein IRT45_21075 [Nocardia sp. BSTN01]|uniref:hypothetical protein n=1 Tax=Nocardia sp. BSTN01 TaxID=2783665 RepID=UPI00188F2025|nr:hypothetical protein [Nocardia sp. BSTN01]MBF4999639.1 hypothetical protein [Nocardia sp. BSTN01]
MRFTASAPTLGAIAVTAILGTAVLIPCAAPANAEAGESLAATAVVDAGAICGHSSPTVDDIATATATALRTVVPAPQQTDFDQRVEEFRGAIATLHVHPDLLAVGPVNDRTQFLDDPIVTNVVNALDAIRSGRIDHTIPLSALTVNDVIEIFILATRVVKIPAQLGASMVPTAGFVLRPIVGALFNGVKALARAVQRQLSTTGCPSPGNYSTLQPDLPDEHVDVPQPLLDLADQVVVADGRCTPIAELTTSEVAERTRNFLTSTPGLVSDVDAVNANAAVLQDFLRENRVAKLAVMRRTEQLGPLVDSADNGVLTFLANLGFDIYEGHALDTVPLAQVRVENVLALVTLALDTTSLLLTAGNSALGLAGVPVTVTTPLGIAQTLAFAPTTYGAPILRGVLQSMCAV